MLKTLSDVFHVTTVELMVAFLLMCVNNGWAKNIFGYEMWNFITSMLFVGLIASIIAGTITWILLKEQNAQEEVIEKEKELITG